MSTSAGTPPTGGDPRFTQQLVYEVFHALERAGYQRPRHAGHHGFAAASDRAVRALRQLVTVFEGGDLDEPDKQ